MSVVLTLLRDLSDSDKLSSGGQAVQDTDDPRELLLAVVADCWARQAHVPAVRLRTLVGMCYWHAALRREQGTAASSLFYWAPQVTVQQLLLAARALVACEGKPADEQRVAVAIVRDAAYAPVFHRPQSTEHHGEEDWRSEGVAEELVEGIFGHGLYRDREQLLVLDVMMDAPDPLAGQWPRSGSYARAYAYLHSCASADEVVWVVAPGCGDTVRA